MSSLRKKLQLARRGGGGVRGGREGGRALLFRKEGCCDIEELPQEWDFLAFFFIMFHCAYP